MICPATGGTVSLRERMLGGEGTVSVRTLFEKGEYHGQCRLMAELTLSPGQSVGRHTHQNDEELVYILEGSCCYEDNGAETVLHSGDAALTLSGESHMLRNCSNAPVRYLAVVLTNA